MEQPNHRGLITESEYKSLETLLFQIRIKDTNSPSAPKKPLLSISFWGSLRIEALVQNDSEKFIDKIINVGEWIKTLREGRGGNFAFIDLNEGFYC